MIKLFGEILFLLCSSSIISQADPLGHSISIYIDDQHLTLPFGEGNYTAQAQAFVEEYGLDSMAGGCYRDGRDMGAYECSVLSLATEMEKTAAAHIASQAVLGLRAFDVRPNSKKSLVVVDNFLSEPQALRHFALSC